MPPIPVALTALLAGGAALPGAAPAAMASAAQTAVQAARARPPRAPAAEALLLPSPAAPPAPRPLSPARLALSFSAGVAVALLPLAAGGAWLASTDSREGRHGALSLLSGGLAVAPVVSHLLAGEDRRAGLFGIPPALSAIGLRVLLGAQPDLVEEGTTEGRVGLIVLLSLTLIGSTVGLIDSLWARERSLRPRQSPRRPAPALPLVGGRP